jgi:glycyl-tRNA synthetase beta chain
VAEKRLHNSTIELSSIIYGSKDYVSNMSQLVGLKSDIDSFFEEVMVNVEDEKIRNSRLSLLYSVRSLFLSVADVSYLS